MSFLARLMGKEIDRGARCGRDPSLDLPPPPSHPPPPYQTAEFFDAEGSLIGTGAVEWEVYEYSLRTTVAVDPPVIGTRVDLVAPGVRYTVWEGAESFAYSGAFHLYLPHALTARALEFIRRG